MCGERVVCIHDNNTHQTGPWTTNIPCLVIVWVDMYFCGGCIKLNGSTISWFSDHIVR